MRALTVAGLVFVLVSRLGLPAPACAADPEALAQATEAGDASAALALGTAYDTGDGVPADPRAALHWYWIAAQQGNTTALFNVGVMYDQGLGTARNPSVAAYWYRRAAEQGNARAAYNLGLLFEDGDGVPRSQASAEHWFHIAGQAGLDAATARLAARPTRPTDADYATAQALIEQRGLAAAAPDVLGLLQRAAGHGIKVAQYDLAYLYENGLGVGADRIAANGDVANKIGTYSVAVLAKENNVPFYVAAPISTLDLSLESGDQIPIEERAASEVTHYAGRPVAPHGTDAKHPAFDVTPHRYVSAIITENGVARAPYVESLRILV